MGVLGPLVGAIVALLGWVIGLTGRLVARVLGLVLMVAGALPTGTGIGATILSVAGSTRTIRTPVGLAAQTAVALAASHAGASTPTSTAVTPFVAGSIR